MARVISFTDERDSSVSTYTSGTGTRDGSNRFSSSTSGGLWETLSAVKMNDLYMISKIRCTSTGLDLIHAKIPGPHVDCYWILPHKLENELGIPHILEHMLWQGGSRDFPVPGLLHKIANRSFSSDLKSWTEKDHSCYCMSVGGKQGFEQLLPVAFDHIFEPDIQEATFLQEVYRMEGNGVDYGTCLEEILEAEKDPEEMSMLELVRKVYGPDAHYSVPFTGTSEALRGINLQAVQMVKEFHEKYYHLTNCCMVICGDVSKEDVCNMLAPLMEKYRTEGSSWVKPWADIPLADPISQQSMTTIQYPSPDGNEKLAEIVRIGILGPHSTEKLNRCVAMRLVLEYLVSGPLHQAFQDYKLYSLDPFGPADNTKVYTETETTLSISEFEWRQTLFVIDIRQVPTQMISAVPDIIRRTMQEQVMNPAAFSYPRMVQVVERFHHEDLANLEEQIGEKICHSLIPDYIYSEDDSELMFDRRVNSPYTIHHFINQPAAFWKYVIQACLLDSKWITVAAVPSQALAEKLAENDKLRLQKRMNDEHIMDTKRIAQRSRAALKLRQKQREHDNGGILEQFKLPAVSSIGFTKVNRHDNPKWAGDTLCNFYFDDIPSSYVYLTVMMDTTELTLEEKKYLVLMSEGILNSPYLDVGEVYKTAEELRMQLARDCLKYETFFGLEWLGRLEDRTRFSCGSFPHLFCLRLQLHVSKIREGFKLCQLVLWNTRWQAEKLKQICQRLVREVDHELKLSGPAMTRAMLVDSLYTLNSVPSAISLIRQKVFLRRLGEELPKSMRRVTKMLEGIRMTLLRPENCTVHVAGSLSGMEFNLTEDPNAREAVRELFRSTFDYTGWHWGYDTRRISNVPDMNWMRSPDCIAKCSREQILRMDKAHFGYLIQASPGVRSWHEPDYSLVLLACQYFIQDGGPLHREIVESGLAQDLDIRVSPSEGIIYFELRHCPNIAKSYGAAFDVIEKHTGSNNDDGEGDSLWDELLLTSAKSSLIFRMTKEEDTPHHVAMLSLLAYYKGMFRLDKAKAHLMNLVADAQMEDVQRVTGKFLKPLFLQPCTCAASAPKEMTIDTMKELIERCGKRLALIPPPEQSSLASYNL